MDIWHEAHSIELNSSNRLSMTTISSPNWKWLMYLPLIWIPNPFHSRRLKESSSATSLFKGLAFGLCSYIRTDTVALTVQSLQHYDTPLRFWTNQRLFHSPQTPRHTRSCKLLYSSAIFALRSSIGVQYPSLFRRSAWKSSSLRSRRRKTASYYKNI